MVSMSSGVLCLTSGSPVVESFNDAMSLHESHLKTWVAMVTARDSCNMPKGNNSLSRVQNLQVTMEVFQSSTKKPTRGRLFTPVSGRLRDPAQEVGERNEGG